MNSCFCVLICYFLCLVSLFSDSSASLYLIHLFWDNQMSENRRRFVVRSFLVFYEYLPMVWRSLCLLPDRPDDKRSCPL